MVFLICGVVLFLFDPATTAFYPPCLFTTVFGRACPGCGSLRAMHQLLHGNLDAAWALNRPIFIAIPLALLAPFLPRRKNKMVPSS
ncbi:MAG TPA: DUF2752 domain-containing protein [Thermoanaerobaculia bacterium]|nr:DUF2752 domain-containing protein [Thermoanaerobaculia bacterium]